MENAQSSAQQEARKLQGLDRVRFVLMRIPKPSVAPRIWIFIPPLTCQARRVNVSKDSRCGSLIRRPGCGACTGLPATRCLGPASGRLISKQRRASLLQGYVQRTTCYRDVSLGCAKQGSPGVGPGVFFRQRQTWEWNWYNVSEPIP